MFPARGHQSSIHQSSIHDTHTHTGCPPLPKGWVSSPASAGPPPELLHLRLQRRVLPGRAACRRQGPLQLGYHLLLVLDGCGERGHLGGGGRGVCQLLALVGSSGGQQARVSELASVQLVAGCWGTIWLAAGCRKLVLG